MFTFIGVVALVFAVLQIILFFKIWGMTNDVAIIVEIMSQEKYKEPNEDTKDWVGAEDIQNFATFVEMASEKDSSFKNLTQREKELAYREYIGK